MRLSWLAAILAGSLATAAGSMQFSMGTNAAVSGGVATVPVTLSGASSNLSAFALYFTNASGFPIPTVVAGPAQPNLVTFVDVFEGNILRLTGVVTNFPSIGNGEIVHLAWNVPAGAAPAVYPLGVLTAAPAGAPVGPNPETRALADSQPLGGTSSGGFICILAGAPHLTSLTYAGGNVFQFACTNLDASKFDVLTSTNVAAPVSQWTSLGPPAQVLPNLFQFTDHSGVGLPQRFYLLKGR